MRIPDGSWFRTLVEAVDDMGSGKVFPAGTKWCVAKAIDGKPVLLEVFENDNRDLGLCLGTIALSEDQVEIVDT